MSTTEHKPAALRLADDRPWQQGDDLYDWAIDAEDMLRSLYAENYAMRAQLKALSEAGSASEDLQLMRLCHSDTVVECHVHAGSRCAGLAIYRTNTAKSQPKEHRLPADHAAVFSNMMEFLAHHSARPSMKGGAE